MALFYTTLLSGTQYISDSLDTLNTNFQALDTAAQYLSASAKVVKNAIANDMFVGPTGSPGQDFFAPIGTVAMFSGAVSAAMIQNGWLLCSGKTVSISSYPTLALTISGIYGNTADPSRFTLPHIATDTIVVGAGNNPPGKYTMVTLASGTTTNINFISLLYFVKAKYV